VCGYESYYLRTFQKPDDDFILLYVYGSLSSNMPGYHALSHLVDDALVSKVKPRMMTAIQIDASAMPNSDLKPPDGGKPQRRGSHSNNPGFGKQLYVLEQQTGLFGDAGGVGAKFAPIKNNIRACFCENLLVVQNETKILCYPWAYEKFVVPKYKLASCNFRKGGSKATLIIAKGFALVAVPLLGLGLALRSSDEALSTMVVVIGIAMMVASIIVSIITEFISVYAVDLVMMKKPPPKEEGSLAFFARAVQNRIMGPELVTLMLRSEPDRNFIMSYVFGVLSSNMGGYHALTHLVKDNLIEPPEPRTVMGAIASTGLQGYMPVAMGVDADHGEVVGGAPLEGSTVEVNISERDSRPSKP